MNSEGFSNGRMFELGLVFERGVNELGRFCERKGSRCRGRPATPASTCETTARRFVFLPLSSNTICPPSKNKDEEPCTQLAAVPPMESAAERCRQPKRESTTLPALWSPALDFTSS